MDFTRRRMLQWTALVPVALAVTNGVPTEVLALTAKDVIGAITAVASAVLGATAIGLGVALVGAGLAYAFQKWAPVDGTLNISSSTAIGYFSGSGSAGNAGGYFPITVGSFAARNGLSGAQAADIFKRLGMLPDANGPWGNVSATNYRLIGSATNSLAGFYWAASGGNGSRFRRALKAYAQAYIKYTADMRRQDADRLRLMADNFMDKDGKKIAAGGTYTNDGCGAGGSNYGNFWGDINRGTGIASGDVPVQREIAATCGGQDYWPVGWGPNGLVINFASSAGVASSRKPNPYNGANGGDGFAASVRYVKALRSDLGNNPSTKQLATWTGKIGAEMNTFIPQLFALIWAIIKAYIKKNLKGKAGRDRVEKEMDDAGFRDVPTDLMDKVSKDYARQGRLMTQDDRKKMMLGFLGILRNDWGVDIDSSAVALANTGSVAAYTSLWLIFDTEDFTDIAEIYDSGGKFRARMK